MRRADFISPGSVRSEQHRFEQRQKTKFSQQTYRHPLRKPCGRGTITAIAMDANNQAHHNTNSVTSVQRKAMCVDQSYKDSVATGNARHSYGASDREQSIKHSLPSNGGQAELEATSNRRAIASFIYHDAHMPYR